MNFDFSPEQVLLQEQARRLFEDARAVRGARAVLDGAGRYDEALWARMAGLGLLGAAVPEAYGGAGAGALELCVLAEEAGRAVAAVPLLSTIYLAADLLARTGSEDVKQRLLPGLVDGSLILAVAERAEKPAASVLPVWRDGVLSGTVEPVLDGGAAGAVIVEALDAGAGGASSLVLVERNASGVAVEDIATIDPSRPQARIGFDRAPGLLLGEPGGARAALDAACDRAAVLVAFEQLGGAERALDMARAYAVGRHAFGRPIGSFQAIKHKLVDMYVALTLARANAFHAAWALETGAAELAQAAAIARVSATEAFQLCARENIQIHGGMGFTWEADCHLLYRRSSLLALALRGGRYWRRRLIETVRTSNALFEPAAAH